MADSREKRLQHRAGCGLQLATNPTVCAPEELDTRGTHKTPPLSARSAIQPKSESPNFDELFDFSFWLPRCRRRIPQNPTGHFAPLRVQVQPPRGKLRVEFVLAGSRASFGEIARPRVWRSVCCAHALRNPTVVSPISHDLWRLFFAKFACCRSFLRISRRRAEGGDGCGAWGHDVGERRVCDLRRRRISRARGCRSDGEPRQQGNPRQQGKPGQQGQPTQPEDTGVEAECATDGSSEDPRTTRAAGAANRFGTA